MVSNIAMKIMIGALIGIGIYIALTKPPLIQLVFGLSVLVAWLLQRVARLENALKRRFEVETIGDLAKPKISYRAKIFISPNWENLIKHFYPEKAESIFRLLAKYRENQIDYFRIGRTFEFFSNPQQIPQIWLDGRLVNDLSFFVQLVDQAGVPLSQIKKVFKGLYGFETTSSGRIAIVPKFLFTPNSIGVVAPYLPEHNGVMPEGEILEIDFGISPYTQPNSETVFGYILESSVNRNNAPISWPKNLKEFLKNNLVSYDYTETNSGSYGEHKLFHRFFNLAIQVEVR